jgi:hypothetical protein
MRDLILQLSKSSIYSTKPFYLVILRRDWSRFLTMRSNFNELSCVTFNGLREASHFPLLHKLQI